MDTGVTTDCHEPLSDSSRARTDSGHLDSGLESIEEVDRVDMSWGSISRQHVLRDGRNKLQGDPSVGARPEDGLNGVAQRANASAVPDGVLPRPDASIDPAAESASSASAAFGTGAEQQTQSAGRKRGCVVC